MDQPWGVVDVSSQGVTSFSNTSTGYDAVVDKGRRKAIAANHRSEDNILRPQDRSRMVANGRDIARNYSLAAWMIRRHLDYVASFDFHSRSGDDPQDKAIEQYMWRWFKPMNCDSAGRHHFQRQVRLLEARAVVDGDCGWLKVADGTLQGIESDRIRQPDNDRENQWVHGIKTDANSRALAYAIHKRVGTGFEFERFVSASNIIMHGYFDRFDQIRGISPLASGLNMLRDSYEGFDLTLAKMKVHQLFALAFYRDAKDSAGVSSSEEGEDGEPVTGRYNVDFGRGPALLDMEIGDRAEFLESKHPSAELREFMLEAVQLTLKALDIPYSFYNEGHTNFFGSRGAWMHYERSCASKRENLGNVLDRTTIWKLGLAISDGQIPGVSKKLRISDLDWEWVPTGMPWWDQAKEVNGDCQAIAAGLDNPQRICKERGKGDFFDNIDQIAAARKYAQERGVDLTFVSHPPAPEVKVSND